MSPAPISEIYMSFFALIPLLLKGYILSHTIEIISAKQTRKWKLHVETLEKTENSLNFAPIKICLSDTNAPVFL